MRARRAGKRKRRSPYKSSATKGKKGGEHKTTVMELMNNGNEGNVGDAALWSGTNKNRDISTGPLTRSFTRLLAPLTRSPAPDCSLCSRLPLRLLIRSWESEFLMSQNDLVLSHSVLVPKTMMTTTMTKTTMTTTMTTTTMTAMMTLVKRWSCGRQTFSYCD